MHDRVGNEENGPQQQREEEAAGTETECSSAFCRLPSDLGSLPEKQTHLLNLSSLQTSTTFSDISHKNALQPQADEHTFSSRTYRLVYLRLDL